MPALTEEASELLLSTASPPGYVTIASCLYREMLPKVHEVFLLGQHPPKCRGLAQFYHLAQNSRIDERKEGGG